MIVPDSLSICIVACYVSEISGAMPKLSRLIYRFALGKTVKYNGWLIPVFACAKCLTFWSVLIYNFYNGETFLNSILFATVFSLASIILVKVITLQIYLIEKLFDYVRNAGELQ